MIHEILRRVPLFQGMTDEQLEALTAIARQRHAPAGEVLFRQDDPGDALFVVLTGSVRIYKLEEERELELGIEGTGAFFGEMSLIDGAPRSAAAAALSDSELLLVGRDEYLALLRGSPAMLNDLLLRLTRNLRASNTHRFGLVQEKERLKAESELEKLRSLSQMVAGLAHEINTPLGIIQNAASLVSETLTPDGVASMARDDAAREALSDVADACRLIQRNIDVAARLVTTFKSLSVRQLAEQRERVDLHQIVTETVDLFRLKARSAKLRVTVACDVPAGDLVWDGYPGHLSQVLLNLLTNVDRYAYPDGRGGDVEIAIRRTSPGEGKPGKAQFEVAVTDHGRGIPPENIDRIWTPFFTTGRDKSGTGLGLAIVHNLITSGLAGSIRVQSKVGEGTTFTMSFPVTTPEGTQP